MDTEKFQNLLKKYNMDNDLGLDDFKQKKQIRGALSDKIMNNSIKKPSMIYFGDRYKMRNRPPSN